MGEMADFIIDQFINPPFDQIEYQLMKEAYYEEWKRRELEKEMEVYKMPDKTYKIIVNSEKKLYRVFPPLARGSYMQRILEPEAFDADSKPEWGCQLRWPMDDAEVQTWAQDMKKLFTLILVDKFGEDKAKKIASNPHTHIPLRNGNNETNEEYEGWLFMNVRNKFRQPIIMGPHAKALPEDLITDEVIYSGAWYRSQLSFRHFDVKGHKIGSYVEGLMKVKDDERLDGVINVGAMEEGFSDFADPDAQIDFPAGTGDENQIKKPDEDTGFDFL